MNENNPLDPASTPQVNNDADLEIRIAALVMGEASDFERAKLEELISNQPELRAMFKELESAHQAMESFSQSSELPDFEAIVSVEDGFDSDSAEDTEWKLPTEKRSQLLDILESTGSPIASAEDTAVVSKEHMPQPEREKTTPADSKAIDWRRYVHLATDRWSNGSIRTKLSYVSAACILLLGGLVLTVQSLMLSRPLERRTSSSIALARNEVRDFSELESLGFAARAAASFQAEAPTDSSSQSEWALNGVDKTALLSELSDDAYGEAETSLDLLYRGRSKTSNFGTPPPEDALSGLRATLGTDLLANNGSDPADLSTATGGIPTPDYRYDDVENRPAPADTSSGPSGFSDQLSFGLQMADANVSGAAPAPELALPSLTPESAGRPSSESLALSLDDKFQSTVPAFGGFDADYTVDIPESAGTELAMEFEEVDQSAIPFDPRTTNEEYFEKSAPLSGSKERDFFDSGLTPADQPFEKELADQDSAARYAVPGKVQLSDGIGQGGGGGSSAGGMYGGVAGMGGGGDGMYGGMGAGMGMGGMNNGMGMGGEDDISGVGTTELRRSGGRQSNSESKDRFQVAPEEGFEPLSARRRERYGTINLAENAPVKQEEKLDAEARGWEMPRELAKKQKAIAPVESPDSDNYLFGGVAIQPEQNLQEARQSSPSPSSNEWFGNVASDDQIGSFGDQLARPTLGFEGGQQAGQELERLSKLSEEDSFIDNMLSIDSEADSAMEDLPAEVIREQLGRPLPQSQRENARAYFFSQNAPDALTTPSIVIPQDEEEPVTELAAMESGFGWDDTTASEVDADSDGAMDMVFADPGLPPVADTGNGREVEQDIALGSRFQRNSESARTAIQQSEAKASDSLRSLALLSQVEQQIQQTQLGEQVAAAQPSVDGEPSSQALGLGDAAGTWRYRSLEEPKQIVEDWTRRSGAVNGGVMLGKNPYLQPASPPARADADKASDELDSVTRLSIIEPTERYLEKYSKPAKVSPSLTKGLQEKLADEEAFSTFSLHVSDVSFKLAYAALSGGQWPEPEKVRIEEFVNAFDYGDPLPSRGSRVACQVEQAIHPFLQQRNVLRVALRTSATGRAMSKPLSLTLLLDNSGSMERPDRQATVRRAFALLASQLQPNDVVTLISFANQPRLLADRVPGSKASELVQKVENLPSEGGTNIEAALQLAFAKAQEQKSAGSQNRVVLLTDGAVNLGDANPDRLADIVLQMREADIAFDAAGISAQDLNDNILETLTRNGDGRYYLLNSEESADDGFAKQIAGALRPSAKNVKVQIEFNPQRVGRYKLLGFEKHRLKKEDFRNDAVDAAEMAAAEAGVAVYQFEAKPDGFGDIGSASVRFRDLSTGQMVENRWPIPYQPEAPRIDQASDSLKIATSAAFFAARLRGEPLGDSVQIDALSNLLAPLQVNSTDSNRVTQLQEMIQVARGLNSSVQP